MEQNNLGRVREDLATMKAALGKGLPFGSADVHFYIAASVASVIFAASGVLGAHGGWPLFLAGLPAILVFLAYLGYFAVKSRSSSKVNVTRRKDYRTTLLILVPVTALALAAQRWAARAGMSHQQFLGVSVVVVGFIFVMIAVTNSWPTRYPRSYWLAAGLPLIAVGLLVPFCTRAQATIAVSWMGAALFALLAIVMHYHLRRQIERMSDAAD